MQISALQNRCNSVFCDEMVENSKKGAETKSFNPFSMYDIKKSVQFMNYKAGPELWFKPCGLRWHNVTAVSNIHELLH